MGSLISICYWLGIEPTHHVLHALAPKKNPSRFWYCILYKHINSFYQVFPLIELFVMSELSAAVKHFNRPNARVRVIFTCNFPLHQNHSHQLNIEPFQFHFNVQILIICQLNRCVTAWTIYCNLLELQTAT